MSSKSESTKNQAELSYDMPIEGAEATENLTKANADFEKEVQINLDRERLTYICDYCGKVNHVDVARCSRCGKRRPRSEYIKAMNAIRDSKQTKDDFAIEKAIKDDEFYKAQQYLQETKDRAISEKEEAQRLAMIRVVEERVADEKQKMAIREEVRVDQEREYAKKMAARDAVLQIIAAEKFADDIIHQTKQEASEAIKEKEDDERKLIESFEDRVIAEREKAINIAAERLVAERAGIERFAIEQIEMTKELSDQEANEKILAERDESEKMAARRAVLQIISAEKAAEDELRLSREALSRAALKRIDEEKDIAQKEYSSKYLAERQGIERAAEERIRAEREAVKKLLEQKRALDSNSNAGYGVYQYNPQNGYTQPRQVTQPFVIVPYVNANQPLLQYKPNQVYRFVPNTYTQQVEAEENAKKNLKTMMEGPEPTENEINEIIAKKQREKNAVEEEIMMLAEADKTTDEYKLTLKKGKTRVRFVALLTALFVLGIAAILWFMPILSGNVYESSSILKSNSNIFMSFLVLIQDGINKIIGTTIAILPTNSYVEFIRELDFMGGIVLPFGMFVAVVAYAVLFIKSIIRLITGKARNKGLFFPILSFVFLQIAIGGIYLATKAVGIDFIENLEYSIYAIEGLGVLLIVLGIINRKNIKK